MEPPVHVFLAALLIGVEGDGGVLRALFGDAYYGYAPWRLGPLPVPWAGLFLDDQSMRSLAEARGDPVDYRVVRLYSARG